MGLYYNTETFELKEISDDFIESLRINNNPKYEAWIIAPAKPGENYSWYNGEWIQDQVSIPQSVSARQVRIWLLQHGISLQQVDTSIDSIQDPILRDITKVEWEYAPYIERSHPMLVPLAQALGLTQDQLDTAFIEAQNI